MRRYYLVICLLLMNILMYSLSPAGATSPQTIRIAAFNFYPTLFQVKDGSVQGFYVDFLKEIAKREGWNIEYVYGNWADGLARIKSGEVDLLTNVAFTSERAEFMDYGKVPLLTVWAELYVAGGSTLDSIREVKGKKVALMKGDFNAANFKNLVEKLQIPCAYVEFGNFEEVFKAIASGTVDAGVVNNTFGAAKQREYGVQSSGIVFNPFDIYFTSAKGKNSQLLTTLDKYLAEWRTSEGSPYHQARENWSHKSVSIMKVTPASIRRVVIFFVLTSCIAIVFVIVLRVQVRRRTSALKHEIEFRKQAEDGLRESKLRLDTILDNVGAYIFIKDTSYNYTYVNRRVCELFGQSEKDIIGKSDAAFFSADSIAEIMGSDQPVIEQGETVRREETDLSSEDRQRRTYWTVKIPLRDSNDNIYGLCGISTDISERKLLEESLHIQAAHLEEELAERQLAQEALQEQTAMLEEEIEERRRAEDALQQSEATIRNKLQAILEPEGDIGTLELSDIIDCEMLRAMLDDFYKVTGILGAVLDTSGNVLVAVGWQDICTKFHRCHPDSLKNCIESDTILTDGVKPGTFKGYRCKNNMWDMVTPLEVAGKHVGNIFIGQFFYEDEPPDVELFREQARHYGFDETEYLAALDRVPRLSREAAAAGMEFYAKLTRMISTLSYSTIKMSKMLVEHEKSESEIKRLAAMLEESQHIAQVGGWEIDLKANTLYWTDETFRIHDTSPSEYTPTLESALAFYAPESLPIINSAVKEALENNKDFDLELKLITAKGRPILVHSTSRVIRENGAPVKILGAFKDITEQKHLEEQLRQSQKMEAIGQLAGGVAHDFNNILTVISGYCSLLMMDKKLDEKQAEQVEQIARSSEKAAQLTRGLLAFSRKQVMIPKLVDLNDILHHVQKFLDRVIGEDVQLKTICNEMKLPITADRGHIEQVLINLTTNARDAMPQGGLLTIETGLQTIEAPIEHAHGLGKPGDYACITVSDTGVGMNEETRGRIFEPFFTTKEVGKGTGLGMAIVYGIIQQHNGFINVYSELNKGTIFRIYLPLVETEQWDHERPKKQAMPEGGTETILVAEDDVSVRKLVTTVLTQFGYEVVEAVDGLDAVNKFTANSNRIDMILMDVIMPNKNGRDAYREISIIKPDVKVLYSSGYTADFIQGRGVNEGEIELITKPVQPVELLRKVRGMLDL